jgi:hypothetical protein
MVSCILHIVYVCLCACLHTKEQHLKRSQCVYLNIEVFVYIMHGMVRMAVNTRF